MNSRPLTGFGHEIFFRTVPQDVAQAVDLGFGFMTDENVFVSSRPQVVLPVVEVVDLLGDVAVDETHRLGKLLGIVSTEQGVVVLCEVSDYVESSV